MAMAIARTEKVVAKVAVAAMAAAWPELDVEARAMVMATIVATSVATLVAMVVARVVARAATRAAAAMEAAEGCDEEESSALRKSQRFARTKRN